MKPIKIVALALLIVIVIIGVYLAIGRSSQDDNNASVATVPSGSSNMPVSAIPDVKEVSEDGFDYLYSAVGTISDTNGINNALSDTFQGDREAIVNDSGNQSALQLYAIGLDKYKGDSQFYKELPDQGKYEVLRDVRNLANLALLRSIVQKDAGQYDKAMNGMIANMKLAEDVRKQASGASVTLAEGMTMLNRDKAWSLIAKLDNKSAKTNLAVFQAIVNESVSPETVNNDFEFGPNKQKALAIRQKNVCLNGMFLVELALQSYKTDNKAYPTNLKQLVPNYLPSVPKDPYSASGYIYKSDKQKYVLYSVGEDGKDDGGAVSSPTSPGRRPSGPDTPSGAG